MPVLVQAFFLRVFKSNFPGQTASAQQHGMETYQYFSARSAK
ncbi:hypothetical protein QSI_1907 [Clostridioides difficile P28]|nr:hypothetical protein QSI_1907 [Clostridioides difficile P28]